MNKPVLSILIATFNSQRTLEKVLDSIRSQTLEKNKYEIIIVDGGSTDHTLSIAKKYKCRILKNPMTEPANAKYLGFMQAKGKYILALDHDEVIVNEDSFKNRLATFAKDIRVNALHSSGYITPPEISQINYYVNEFGDPFSFFIYKLSKDYRFFIKTMAEKYKIVTKNTNYVLFKVDKSQDRAPLMEVLAGGCMVDKDFVLKNFKQLSKKKGLFLPHLHLHLLSVNSHIAIAKNDPLLHYSAESIQKYLRKLEWRVKNNIYFIETSGAAGFLKREEFESKEKSLRKFLFLPYAFSILFPLIDSIYLVTTRRKIVYMLHLPLTVYTSILIVYHLLRKFSGHLPFLTSYDGAKKITKKWR